MAVTTPSIDFSKIDFNELKQELIKYISNVSEFNSVNVEGSNFNLLVNLLAYVTNIISYNYNQGLNEVFLPNAQLRENILKIIKILNYTPLRATSAKIRLNLTGFTKVNSAPALLKYDKVLSAGFNFYYIGDAIDVTNETELLDVPFYEGTLVVKEDAYTAIGNTNFESFEIEETDIGTHFVLFSIDGTTRTNFSEYEKGKLYTDPGTQNIYFIEETVKGYKITFGNDKLGRKLIQNEIIGYEYLKPDTTGDTNNLVKFTWVGGGIAELVNTNELVTDYLSAVSTITLNENNTSSTGADVKETIEEIKLNAPRFYQAQGRCVNEEDYLAMILRHPDVQLAQSVGGEKFVPPRLGKVYITVKPDLNAHPAQNFTDGELQVLKEYLDDLNVVSIEPMLQNPQYINLILTSKLRYSKAGRTPNSGNVITEILNFVNVDNANFGEYLEFSKLRKTIDDADPLITSNITTVKKYITLTESNLTGLTEDGRYSFTVAKNADTTFATYIEVYDSQTGSPHTYYGSTDIDNALDFYVEYVDATEGTIKIIWQNTGNLGLTQTAAPDEVRFYFETEDDDIFLNIGQIFNIVENNITLATEKV